MKTVKGFYFPAIIIIVVLVSFAFTGINESRPYYDQLDVLKRIPDGEFFVMSVNPQDILFSEFAKFVLDKESSDTEIAEANIKLEEMFGIKIEDIERITFFSEEFNKIEDSGGVIVEMDASNLQYKHLLDEKGITSEKIQISGFDVEYLSEPSKKYSEKLYFYHDDNEVLAAATMDMMQKMLDLKKGKGENISKNKDFADKIKDLKYGKSIWVHIPTKKVVEDVLNKVKMGKPEILDEDFSFTGLLCGVNLSSDLRLDLKTYNPNEEQLKHILELAEGIKALGMLTLAEHPDIKNLLDKIELKSNKDYFEIEAKITQKDFMLIKNIDKM